MAADSVNSEQFDRFTLQEFSRESESDQSQQLRILFGHLELTPTELSSLKIGQVLQLLETAEGPLELVRGDRLIGYAKAVQYQSHLAWEIVELIENLKPVCEVTE